MPNKPILMKKSEHSQKIKIPESELRFSFSRSGGAGGQNVNKVETKVAAHWNFRKSTILTSEQKNLIAEKLANKINESGEVTAYSQEERSQQTNRGKSVLALNESINRAITVMPKRRKTKVPRREKRKRLEQKRRVSERKLARKSFKE